MTCKKRKYYRAFDHQDLRNKKELNHTRICMKCKTGPISPKKESMEQPETVSHVKIPTKVIQTVSNSATTSPTSSKPATRSVLKPLMNERDDAPTKFEDLPASDPSAKVEDLCDALEGVHLNEKVIQNQGILRYGLFLHIAIVLSDVEL